MSAVAPTKLTPNTPAMGVQRKYTTDDRARITVETDSIPKMLAKAEEYDRMAAHNRKYFQTEGEAENTDLAAVFRGVVAIFERGLAASPPLSSGAAPALPRAHAAALPVATVTEKTEMSLSEILDDATIPASIRKELREKKAAHSLTEAQKFEQLVAANHANAAKRPTPPLTGV